MRRPAVLAAGLLVAGGVAALGVAVSLEPRLARAEDATINAAQINVFMGAEAGERVQGLVWRGGLEMRGPSDTFGGLSGLGFVSAQGHLVMVSDRGR